jgi:SagB-type dehydrogenase family enzyme
MRLGALALSLLGGAWLLNSMVTDEASTRADRAGGSESIPLPAPRLDGDFSVERALRERRSVREYRPAPLTLAEVSQLLWAAQGVTARGGLRTAPSAGALYPLELYLVTGNAENAAAGIYHYLPETHRLVSKARGDARGKLVRAALGQESVEQAAVVLVFAAVEERTTGKYGERGVRFVHMEVGHAAQNVLLQATALGLGAVVVGAFDDRGVQRALGLPEGEAPLYLVPVGRR